MRTVHMHGMGYLRFLLFYNTCAYVFQERYLLTGTQCHLQIHIEYLQQRVRITYGFV